MSDQNNQANPLFRHVVFHAILVLSIGLVAGLMLAFSLLDAVNLWPLPVWEVAIPGSDRGWAAAHVGGILNGIMLIVLIQLATKLDLADRDFRLSAWSLIITGWGNTVFYWAGNIAPNRGLSVDDTVYGGADIWGILAFLGGGGAMFFTFFVMFLFGRAALQRT
jgi:styrene-oxide isomerase